MPTFFEVFMGSFHSLKLFLYLLFGTELILHLAIASALGVEENSEKLLQKIDKLNNQL